MVFGGNERLFLQINGAVHTHHFIYIFSARRCSLPFAACIHCDHTRQISHSANFFLLTLHFYLQANSLSLSRSFPRSIDDLLPETINPAEFSVVKHINGGELTVDDPRRRLAAPLIFSVSKSRVEPLGRV